MIRLVAALRPIAAFGRMSRVCGFARRTLRKTASPLTGRDEIRSESLRLSARPKNVRTLIVNGEAAARAQLYRLCADRPDLDVVAEATSGAQAIDVIHSSDAD